MLASVDITDSWTGGYHVTPLGGSWVGTTATAGASTLLGGATDAPPVDPPPLAPPPAETESNRLCSGGGALSPVSWIRVEHISVSMAYE